MAPSINSGQARGTSKRSHNNEIIQGAQISIEVLRDSVNVPSTKPSEAGRLNFISKKSTKWVEVEKKFNGLTSSTNGSLHRSQFAECIGMDAKSNEFALELFDALARRRKITADSINKDEFKEFWEQISAKDFNSRLRIFFDMVDKDSNGKLDVDEVRQIIKYSASANKLSNINIRAQEYATMIMEELDEEKLGYIMIDKLEMLFRKQDGKQSPIEEHKPTKDTGRVSELLNKIKYYLIENWERIWVLVLWIGIMIGLFTFKFIQYRNKADPTETLKFNMALILFPVCRNTITWLRNKTKLGAFIPFDNSITFHKVIATAIGIGVAVHALAHLTCDFPRLLHATKQAYEPMKPYFGEDQPDNYWWFLKGVEGVTGIIMVVLMAIALTLATPKLRLKKDNGFNMFWYSHHLFIIVYTLLIVHGIKTYLSKDWYTKSTWMYLAVPITLYTCERLLRSFRSRVKSVKILEFNEYPDVMAIHMSKPDGFEYKSGEYMFVKCPAVSPFEWHPFSITSSPAEDRLSVHIRAVGDWTKELKAILSEASKEGESLPVEATGGSSTVTQDYKDFEVVLLVGLGIGATPMISIIKDIVHNMKPKDLEGGKSTTNRNNFKTKRAYFYWVTNDQGSFEWFKDVMDDVSKMDINGVIELHNHCTSIFEEDDARSALIASLQSLNHAKTGIDIVSGTHVKSYFGRPNWRDIYKTIAQNHSGKRVGVFYCGAPGPAASLRQLALDFSHETSTKFDFRKENF
ncbi:hypothetical protein MKW92_032024 [Papaver armeniacum]|nr:hypothetical protein MKW92_032024 [Papaver armeniacum]